MARRTKAVLLLLGLASMIGLVAATNAWFVSVSVTPPGTVDSALVRYLPESGARSADSLLTYGSLVSGGSIDPEGIPLVLPADSLLSTVAVDASGKRTLRTSIARDFEGGAAPETEGTVIHWEIRDYLVTNPDGTAETIRLTRKQRDLMYAPDPADHWYEGTSTVPMETPPKLNPTEYEIVTDTATNWPGEVVGNQTTVTTTVTTAYTPHKDGASSYRHVLTTVTVVTAEAASITPAEHAALWDPNAPPDRRIVTTETVLSVPDPASELLKDLPTRSHLVIEEYGFSDGAAPHEAASLPLSVGNLSTRDSALRVGLTATLTGSDGKSVPLELRGPDANGVYYLGLLDDGVGGTGKFIELLYFKPADGAGAYSWVFSGQDSDKVWSLWDLTFPDGSTAVPALPKPAEEPAAAGSPVPSESVSTPPEPVLYQAVERLGVVSGPAGFADSLPADDQFEQRFNELYCVGTPTIRLKVSYYARQSEFMEWNEFYSQSIEMGVAP